MKAINKKLIFGTANLSKPYGINSQKIQNHNSIKNIIEFLKKEKINFVDTAYSYGSAIKDLGKNRIQKFNIISKLPNLQSTNSKLLEEEIYKTTFEMIYNLRIKKLYGLLIHNTNNLNGAKGIKIYNVLKKLKKEGFVKKIGYSIYSTKELDKFCFKFPPDVIQGPLNLFDQTIVSSGWLGKLKKKKIEFHSRSIFLQGLLLKKKGKLPRKFNRFNQIFKNYHAFLKKSKLEAFEACLLFVCSIKLINRIVIGIDNLSQLKKIVNFKNKTGNYNFKKLECKKESLINPTKWNYL